MSDVKKLQAAYLALADEAKAQGFYVRVGLWPSSYEGSSAHAAVEQMLAAGDAERREQETSCGREWIVSIERSIGQSAISAQYDRPRYCCDDTGDNPPCDCPVAA